MTFNGIRSHGYQFRSCGKGHGPRHGPSLQPGLGCRHGPRWKPTQISMALVEVWILETNMDSGVWLDPGHPLCLGWLTKAMDIDTDPGCRAMDSDMAPVAVQAWMSSCPPVAVQATKINMAPVAAWPLNIKMAIGGGPYPGHHCGLGGNVSHGYQHRLRLSNKLPHQPVFHPHFFRTVFYHRTWSMLPCLLSHFTTI